MFLYNLCCDDTEKKRKLCRQEDDVKPKKTTANNIIEPRKGQSVKKMLTKEDLANLENEDTRLQDVHMAVAGSLILKKFPTQAGFQPTLYSPERLRPQEEGTIQFHFDANRQHWTTSTYSGGTIRYFDSLYPGYISAEVQQQLKALYGHLMKTPTASALRVQQQQGTVDCGLFAIAYAVSLAHGKDPAKTKFCQKSMRSFYVNCIRKEQIEKSVARVARPDTIIL